MCIYIITIKFQVNEYLIEIPLNELDMSFDPTNSPTNMWNSLI